MCVRPRTRWGAGWPHTRGAAAGRGAQNWYWQPFYYNYVRDAFARGTRQIAMPLEAYVFRYDRGVFFMTEATAPEACGPLGRALLGWALCGRIGGAAGPKDDAEKTRKMAEVVIHDVTVRRARGIRGVPLAPP